MDLDLCLVAFLIEMTIKVQNKSGKMLKDFLKAIDEEPEVVALRKEVEDFAGGFAMPGFDVNKIDYCF